MIDTAREIALVLRSHLDRCWGASEWDDLVYQFLTAERRTVVRTLLSEDEARGKISASQSEFDRGLQYLTDSGLVIKPHDGNLLLLSPLGYAWLLESGNLRAATERVGKPITEVVKRRLQRSHGPKKKGKLSAKDASYLLLLLIAGAVSEQTALRIDRTGEGSARSACDLLNYILDQTAKGSPSRWTVDAFHNYGRSKSLDKKTQLNGSGEGAVRHNDWKQASEPKAWIIDNAPDTLRRLLAAAIAPLDPNMVLDLLRRHAARPIYAQRNIGPAVTAFAQLFGHVDVPRDYRKQLVDIAADLIGQRSSEHRSSASGL